MKKLKLVVSDFHLSNGTHRRDGGLNPLEDFHYDQRFKELIEHHTQGEYEGCEVELIFNGDMLNLIQTDYHGYFPVILTENISLDKLKGIIEGHPLFFKTLRDFLSQAKNSMTYVVGNHDQEMYWKSCRNLFNQAVGREIQWKNIYYQFDGVHIEHGHQYEAINRVDTTRPFLTEGLPEPILNLPWGTLFTIQYIVPLKHKFPYIDKVRPFRMLIWWNFLYHPLDTVLYLLRLGTYFLSTRFTRNRYRRSDWKTTMKMLREASVFPDLSDYAKKILRSPDVHTVIFGHTHVYKYIRVSAGKQYINLGTWNDIVSMELDTFARRSRLTFGRIEYHEDQPTPLAFLRHWIGKPRLEDDVLL